MALAKCPMRPYIFAGKIVHFEYHSPIQGAKVFLFLDKQESTYSRGFETKYPDFFLTNVEGNFNASSYFKSYSGYSLFDGDQCNKNPEVIELLIVHEGFLTKRMIFDISILESNREGSEKIYNLPIIELIPSRK
jgi:hypothetical protein